jgi:hypothetical protein
MAANAPNTFATVPITINAIGATAADRMGPSEISGESNDVLLATEPVIWRPVFEIHVQDLADTFAARWFQAWAATGTLRP